MKAETQTDTQPQLFRLVQDARLKRLDSHPEEGPRALSGECPQNAISVARECRKDSVDWDVRVVAGGLDLEGEPVPESYERARLDGTVHYWVEAKHPEGDSWYVMDASSEDRETLYMPLADSSLPESYVTFDQYAFEFTGWLTPETLAQNELQAEYSKQVSEYKIRSPAVSE